MLVLVSLGACSFYVQTRYEAAKCRVRTATAADGNVTLPILTVKLWPSAPLVDLECCQRFRDGRPVDEQSKIALEVQESTTIIYDALRRADRRNEFDMERVFSGALRIIKLWAFRRCIYGSSTGYLGGGAWAVLLAHTMIQGIRDKSLNSSSSITTVVKHFFEAGSRWSLPLSINLWSDDDSISNRPMTICSSPTNVDNLAQSTTRPTSLAVLAELKRSSFLLVSATQASLPSQLRTVLEPLTLADFLSTFETTLVIHVTAIPEHTASSDFVLADIKAWARRQLLYLTVKLEHVVEDASQIRPRPTPVRVASRHTLLWFIGLQSPLSTDLLEYVDGKESVTQQDWKSSFRCQVNVPTLELKNSQDTLEYMVNEFGIDVNKH